MASKIYTITIMTSPLVVEKEIRMRTNRQLAVSLFHQKVKEGRWLVVLSDGKGETIVMASHGKVK